MFVIDPSFTHINAKPEQLISMFISINAVTVKVPGFPSEPARAYAVGWNRGKNLVTCVLCLHYTQSQTVVGYRNDPADFPMAQYMGTMDEAEGFFSSMGFMFDQVTVASLSPDEKRDLVERIPIFRPVQALSQAKVEDAIELVDLVDVVDTDNPANTGRSNQRSVAQLLMSL